MKSNHRGNALLVELLIVVMFFMLSATVLIQVFARARNQSVQAERIAGAVAVCQDVADRLYAAGDAEEALRTLGFEEAGDGGWTRQDAAFLLTVRTGEEPAEGGILSRREITATDSAGEVLLRLPCSRYREVSP